MVGRLNSDFSYCLCFCFTHSFASLCVLAKLWDVLIFANLALIDHTSTNLPEASLLTGKVHVWQITLRMDVLLIYVWRHSSASVCTTPESINCHSKMALVMLLDTTLLTRTSVCESRKNIDSRDGSWPTALDFSLRHALTFGATWLQTCSSALPAGWLHRALYCLILSSHWGLEARLTI